MIRKPRIDKFGHVHPPRYFAPVRLVITIVLLLIISLGAREGLERLLTSIEHYTPPAMPETRAGKGTTPVAQHAVVVLISGLREDASREMPALESLRQRGAYVKLSAPWPTTPSTTWTTLLTGATPEISGAIGLPTMETDRPVTVDSVLERARVMRYATALVGHERWLATIPTSGATDVVASDGYDNLDDARLMTRALEVFEARRPHLTVIQLSQVDAAGMSYGGASDEYYRATQRADQLVRRLLAAIDLQDTLVVITSNHGHLDRGGYGGLEPIVATTPLIIAGPGVKAGDYGTAHQIDVAPTLAAFTGLPVPAHSQGAVLFSVLDVRSPLRTEKALNLAEQQVKLSDGYLRAVGQGGGSDQPARTLRVARSAWDINNVEGAFEIARQAEQKARDEMASGRRAKIQQQSRRRLPVVVAASIASLAGLLGLLKLRKTWLLGAGLLAWLGPLGQARMLAVLFDAPVLRWMPAAIGGGLAISAALSLRQGNRRERLVVAGAALVAGVLFTYTQPRILWPSGLENTEAVPGTLAWRGVAALLVGAIAVLSLVWRAEEDLVGITRRTYLFVLVVVAGLLMEITAGYWLLGLTLTWYLPDPMLLYWQVANLTHTIWIAGLGILLPALVAASLFALQQIRVRASIASSLNPRDIGQVQP